MECNSDGESVSNPTSEWDIGKFESTSSSPASDTTTSAAADQPPLLTPSAPSKTVSWDVPAADAPMPSQPVEQAGMGPGEGGSSLDTFVGLHEKVNDERAR